MTKNNFSNIARTLTLTALTTLLSFNASAEIAEGPARLAQAESLSVFINQKQTPIMLKAENQNQPVLNVTLKRSLRLVDSQIELIDFLKQGVGLSKIQDIFRAYGFENINSFQDLIIVKNFANGVKGFKAEDIFKKSMGETEQTHFWYAIMPKSVLVDRILVQREWFSDGVGAHGQIRFQLNSPILLVPQEQILKNLNVQDMTKTDWKKRFAVEASQVHMIPGDIVYSLYALRYADGPADWSFTTGMGGVFANAYTLSSVAHNVVYLAKDDFVEQHEMLNARGAGTRVLLSALKRADQYKEQKIYHLIFNSCINELNRALHADGLGYPLKSAGINSSDFNPYTFIENLTPFLIPTAVTSLNAEFSSPVQAKYIKPELEKAMLIVRSKQFEFAVQKLAYDALGLTYKDLNEIKDIFTSLITKAKGGQNPKLSDMTSHAKLMGALASEGYRLSLKQRTVLLGLINNPDLAGSIKLLIQKGLIDLEKGS